MALTRYRSISLPIVLAGVSVALSIALLVGWTFLVVENVELSQQVVANSWLLIAGNLAFIVIMTVLVLFTVFQVRQILEGRRQIRFIDSVTHELRSPLASLKLTVQTLNRRRLTEEQRTQLQDNMLDDLDRLSAFIEDILEASRVDAGDGDLALSEVDLGELCARCAQRVLTRYRAPPEAITLDVPAGTTLVTDITSLETILRNLLDNAVKYSDEPVAVRLRARVLRGERVEIEVRDHGIGIPREDLRRVFQRFYRVSSESVRSRKGTGLGLFVVSSLVHNLGGVLTADSPGPGQGSTFRFDLPLGDLKSVNQRQPDTPRQTRSRHAGAKA